MAANSGETSTNRIATGYSPVPMRRSPATRRSILNCRGASSVRSWNGIPTTRSFRAYELLTKKFDDFVNRMSRQGQQQRGLIVHDRQQCRGQPAELDESVAHCEQFARSNCETLLTFRCSQILGPQEPSRRPTSLRTRCSGTTRNPVGGRMNATRAVSGHTSMPTADECTASSTTVTTSEAAGVPPAPAGDEWDDSPR